ncbi:MAG: peptidylprolyl isomerase [Pedobacter sp.]|nr:MAG: peptidylprolyl isomerase [Pedobacter sp.]
MGIMTFLRNRAGFILVGAIAFAIIAFLVGDALQSGRPFWEASNREVGSINGTSISYDEFAPKVDQNLEQFKQQYGSSVNPQMQAMAVDNVWQSEVANIILSKEYDRLGLSVSGDELFDLMQGSNPSPIIMQYFGNPQTGEFDRAAVISSLKARTNDANLRMQWEILEKEIENQTLQSKYANLIKNSVYVTSLETEDDYNNRNKLANFNYVSINYNSILDDAVKLTDADYQAFYEERKSAFTNPQEARKIEYVKFSFNPTAADSLLIKQQVEKLAVDFKNTKNDSLFAVSNSDVAVPYTYLTKGNLDPAVDSVIFNYPAGSFYGPVLTGNSYKLIKVIDSKISPDSVKASHILINPMDVGGEAAAYKLADSLKNLASRGGNFAQLAKTFSVDGSKDKGGDLGTFGRGAMVPEFENAAFNGKAGDLKIVKTQFGIHLLKIERQIGASKVAKLAYIEKSVAPSSKTKDMAHRKATTFMNAVNSGNFSEVAKKDNFQVLVADRITSSQGFVSGLDNPRPMVRAAYEADNGDVLEEIFAMEDAYVVARVANVYPKGQMSLADVKDIIEPGVRNKKKAAMISEKMNAALKGASSLEQVAQKLGTVVNPLENIVFANPVIPGLAQENKVVGAVFGSPVGKLSQPVEGMMGVYAFVVNGFSNPAPIANMFKQKQLLASSVSQRAIGIAFQALQDKAEIKDNRYKFY